MAYNPTEKGTPKEILADLKKMGFRLDKDESEEGVRGIKNYSGAKTSKDIGKMIAKHGFVRDKKQFAGHINFKRDKDGFRAQIAKRGSLTNVSFWPAPKGIKESMRFKDFITEKFNKVKIARQIAKELQHKDWGYSKDGGNGKVQAMKDGTLKVWDGYYYEGPATLKQLEKNFVGGVSRSEGDYFQKKYNIVFHLKSKDIQRTKKLYPGSEKGVVEIHLDIDGGAMSND
jgi:hypothetical protein